MRPWVVPLILFIGIGVVAAGVLAGVLWYVVEAVSEDVADLPGRVVVFGVAGFALLAAVLAWSWAWVYRCWVRPLTVLNRQAQTVIHSKAERGVEIESGHLLGQLPETVRTLADQLLDARREVVKAMAAASASVEQEKSRLEAVLMDVNEGVLVCNPEHRILLYNQAAVRILGNPVALGLGRLVFNLVTREPVIHAVERAKYRLETNRAAGGAERSVPLVCATVDSRMMLQGRISPILDAKDRLAGYVLTLTDVGVRMRHVAARDRLLRAATDELRAPAANLLAASETLASHPELTGNERSAFERVLLGESTRLSERVESLASQYRNLTGASWPTFDVYSADLLNCVIRRFEDKADLRITMVGVPLWLHGDSHSLMLALERLIERIHESTRATTFDVEPLLGDRHVYVDIVWQGEPIPSRTLDRWLEDPLDGWAGTGPLRQVFERHDSELWSQRHRHGGALLRVPLPLPLRPQFEKPVETLPPRPVFYDFDLMGQRAGDADLGNRSLGELSYVVFDTETTGLQPSAGDEIISIAGVRIVNRRILPGETFERLVNPKRTIPKNSIRFHGITEEMIQDKPPLDVVLPQFKSFVGRATLVGHNTAFDMKFIRLKEEACGVHFDNTVLDTLLLSVFLHRDAQDQTLDGIAARLGIEAVDRHTALGDALTTAAIFVHLIDLLEANGVKTLAQALDASSTMVDILKRQARF